jgi:hypothetical protein
MKKIYLVFVFFIIGFTSFADNEQVCVITSPTNEACSASTLGFVSPCQTLTFKVKGDIPPGFILAAKYEWFVNGISMKTTTNPDDPLFDWTIISKPLNVYCEITYKKLDGTLSSVFTSNIFSPNIKDLNFPQTISTSTPPANYGCSTATVSYNLNTYTCTGSFCDAVYTVGSYNITWQAPTGWVQTSLTNNGSNVSFTPDATSAGTLTATITLPCGYTETRTFTVTRGASAPTFTNATVTSCTSSASMSITPQCGASDYTYSITGNPGVKFTSNNLQTLTTTATTVGISISGGYSTNQVTAKANYPNSTSSANASADLIAGSPSPSPINTLLVDPDFGKIQVESLPAIAGATDYRWYKDGVLQTIYHSTFAQISIPRDVCDVGYGITVTETNACGTSAPTYLGVFVPCNGDYYKVSPNPATSQINISADESKTQSSLNKTFDEVRIYDLQGTLKKYQSFSKSASASINTSALTPGNYFVEIINGAYKEKHQLIIQ